MKKGMTLIEVLVSLVILTFILASVFSILNLQTTKSATVRRTAINQTDAQVALTLLKWDLASTGLAYPKVDTAILFSDGGGGAPDTMTLRAVGLGFEAATTKWSWLLEKAGSNTCLVRAWAGADSVLNFTNGNMIVVLDRERRILDPPGVMTIQSMTPDTFVDPNGDSVPALELTLDQTLSSIAGMVVISIDTTIYDPGLSVYVDATNKQLIRGNEILLENVEALDFAFGTDTDGDEVIDSWQTTMPANMISSGRVWAIRYTLVTTTRPLTDYRFPNASYTLENLTVGPLNPTEIRQKRLFLTGLVTPPNLQP